MKRWGAVLAFLHLCLWCSAAGRGSVKRLAPTFDVDLDKDQHDRWTDVVEHFKPGILTMLDDVETLVPKKVLDLVSRIGDDVVGEIIWYGGEMVGIAKAVDRPANRVLVANIFYELTAYGHGGDGGATSIVAEDINGTIFHGRNLDFKFTDTLRDLTITVNFYSKGMWAYTGTTFAGMVGLVTGMKPNSYTVTLDGRNSETTREMRWLDELGLILDLEGFGGYTSPSTFFRSLFIETIPKGDFSEAVSSCSGFDQLPSLTPCYFIVGGLGPNEGAVITSTGMPDSYTSDVWQFLITNATMPDNSTSDVWRLNTTIDRWFLVETNYDHQDPPPPSDDRRDTAINALKAIGREKFTAGSLIDVLSISPIYNSRTVYTVLMSASDPSLYQTWI